MRVPLTFLGLKIAKKFPVNGLVSSLSRLSPGLKKDLVKTELRLDERDYLTVILVNSLVYFILLFALFAFLIFSQGNDIFISILQGLGYSLLILVLFLLLFLRYPKILAGKKSEQVDRNLIFALKDLLLQVSSGVSLYDAIVNISKENYGLASKEFEFVAKEVHAGISMEKALEKLAVRSNSEFMRRTVWQLVNTLHAGASLKGALRNIINEITAEKKSKISDFAHELNLWSLLYMVFAVAVPTIGVTMLIILSSFAGFGITKVMFIFFLVLCFLIQVILIGFVKSRRPVVNI
jgi:flagellar protein FlaJ